MPEYEVESNTAGRFGRGIWEDTLVVGLLFGLDLRTSKRGGGNLMDGVVVLWTYDQKSLSDTHKTVKSIGVQRLNNMIS